MKKVFNKLVRDKMIDVWEYDIANKISASGYAACYVSPEKTLELLKDKLLEESQEVLKLIAKKINHTLRKSLQML
jgi:predicted house-cleaning noncanonical NTP pyrophosphatase (MazG superfamily)